MEKGYFYVYGGKCLPLVVVGEVQEVAANGSGLGQVTLGLSSGEHSLSEVLEF